MNLCVQLPLVLTGEWNAAPGPRDFLTLCGTPWPRQTNFSDDPLLIVTVALFAGRTK